MPFEAPSQPTSPIRYCYHCGRRVNAGRETCWGCGKPTMRRIHPEQLCPFCRREVPRGAVKCGHCGEWMDGRDHRPQPIPEQTVFVVDKTLTGAGEDYGLAGGQRVPPQIAQTLHPQTVRAIEQNRPELIHQPGVLALPSPSMLDARGAVVDDDDVIEGTIVQVSAAPGSLAPSAAASFTSGSRHSIRMITDARGGQSLPPLAGYGAEMPVRDQERPRTLAARTGAILGRSLGALARRVFTRRPRGGSFQYDDSVEGAVTDRTMICDQCSTEVLVSDRFCYHCGRQFFAPGEKPQVRIEYASNTGLFVAILILIGGVYAFRRGWMPEFFPFATLLTAALALLLCTAAFFRRRTFISQCIAIALGIFTVGVYLFHSAIAILIGI